MGHPRPRQEERHGQSLTGVRYTRREDQGQVEEGARFLGTLCVLRTLLLLLRGSQRQKKVMLRVEVVELAVSRSFAGWLVTEYSLSASRTDVAPCRRSPAFSWSFLDLDSSFSLKK